MGHGPDEDEELWFEADAELIKEAGRRADLRDETISEFVAECCRRYDDSIGENG